MYGATVRSLVIIQLERDPAHTGFPKDWTKSLYAGIPPRPPQQTPSPIARLPLDAQLSALRTTLSHNDVLLKILERTATLNLPHWYLTAGCLFQTVWNVVSRVDDVLPGGATGAGRPVAGLCAARAGRRLQPGGAAESGTGASGGVRDEDGAVAGGVAGVAGHVMAPTFAARPSSPPSRSFRKKRLIGDRSIPRVWCTRERRWFGRCMQTGRVRWLRASGPSPHPVRCRTSA